MLGLRLVAAAEAGAGVGVEAAAEALGRLWHGWEVRAGGGGGGAGGEQHWGSLLGVGSASVVRAPRRKHGLMGGDPRTGSLMYGIPAHTLPAGDTATLHAGFGAGYRSPEAG